jgi:hypothetical protein
MDLVDRHRRIQRGHELTHGANRRGIGIHRPDVEPAPEEIRKIATGAAAGIDDTRTPIESATQELIEQIDIDPAELRFQFVGHAGDVGSMLDDTVRFLLG